MKNKRNIKWLLLIVFAIAVMSGGGGCGGSGGDTPTPAPTPEERALELITPFYNLFRANLWEGGVRDFDEGFKNHNENWLSYDGNPPPFGDTVPRGIAETLGFLGGYMFVKIPDLHVEIITVQVIDDWIFVRSELTGKFDYDLALFPGETEKNYFGLAVGDDEFSIMALDYHRFERINGELKLVELYHTENWGMAVLQSLGYI